MSQIHTNIFMDLHIINVPLWLKICVRATGPIQQLVRQPAGGTTRWFRIGEIKNGRIQHGTANFL